MMEEMLREDQVVRSWAQPLGLHVEPLTRKEFLCWQVQPPPQPPRIGSMAAFRVRSLVGGFFYGAVCVLEEAPTETAVGTYDRLRGALHQAIAQFDSLNSGRQVPNLLLWLNQDKRRAAEDLVAVLSNFVELSNEGLNKGLEDSLLSYRQSRVLDWDYNIDAHVWLNCTGESAESGESGDAIYHPIYDTIYHLVQDERYPEHFTQLQQCLRLPVENSAPALEGGAENKTF